MGKILSYILSRASETGSPTNRSGSNKTPGQGSFGPSTGGPDLKGTNRTFDSPFLLRQVEPGKSQYLPCSLDIHRYTLDTSVLEPL